MLIKNTIIKESVIVCFFMSLFIQFTAFGQADINCTNKIRSVHNLDSSKENIALRFEIKKLKLENSNLNAEISNLRKESNEHVFSCCDCPKSQCSTAIFIALLGEDGDIAY